MVASVCAGMSLWTYHVAKVYVVIWLVGMFFEHFLHTHKHRWVWIISSAMCIMPFLISELLLDYDLNQEQVIDIARDSVTIKKTKDIPIESVRNHYDAIYSFQKIVNLRGYKEDKKVLEAFYLSSASHDYPDNH